MNTPSNRNYHNDLRHLVIKFRDLGGALMFEAMLTIRWLWTALKTTLQTVWRFAHPNFSILAQDSGRLSGVEVASPESLDKVERDRRRGQQAERSPVIVLGLSAPFDRFPSPPEPTAVIFPTSRRTRH